LFLLSDLDIMMFPFYLIIWQLPFYQTYDE